jgi:hypothetical protein
MDGEDDAAAPGSGPSYFFFIATWFADAEMPVQPRKRPNRCLDVSAKDYLGPTPTCLHGTLPTIETSLSSNLALRPSSPFG